MSIDNRSLITEPQRQVPVYRKVDVAVVGGSPAGRPSRPKQSSMPVGMRTLTGYWRYTLTGGLICTIIRYRNIFPYRLNTLS